MIVMVVILAVLAKALELRKLQDEQIAWKLLRAKNAPVILAVLDHHLGGETRRLPVPEVTSLVEIDLEELRFRGNFDLDRSAQAYCEQWRADGYLTRRPLAQTRQETYELSAGALSAISFANRLIQPYRSATQSRLNTIITQINELSLATDYREENRKAALLEERARINEQLERIEQGYVETLDADEAVERIRDIVNLAIEIPDDFVHVRDDFELINKSLHASIISSEEESSDVLEDIFSGVDQISQSASGRSFKGFYTLLRDADTAEALQDNIDSILESDFSQELNIEERRFLRGLLKNFLTQSQDVNAVMTTFARGLRRFVQTQDYRRERVLKKELDQALSNAQKLLDLYPSNTSAGDPLNLTSVRIMPVSRWKLKNPSESRAAQIERIQLIEGEALSLEQLREMARETEIDFVELRKNVNSYLQELSRYGAKGASIGQVLEAYPATQGIASIVGLLVLAAEQGRRTEGIEAALWQNKAGKWKKAHIERWEFYREVRL